MASILDSAVSFEDSFIRPFGASILSIMSMFDFGSSLIFKHLRLFDLVAAFAPEMPSNPSSQACVDTEIGTTSASDRAASRPYRRASDRAALIMKDHEQKATYDDIVGNHFKESSGGHLLYPCQQHERLDILAKLLPDVVVGS